MEAADIRGRELMAFDEERKELKGALIQVNVGKMRLALRWRPPPQKLLRTFIHPAETRIQPEPGGSVRYYCKRLLHTDRHTPAG